jgi:hypothetical protein
VRAALARVSAFMVGIGKPWCQETPSAVLNACPFWSDSRHRCWRLTGRQHRDDLHLCTCGALYAGGVQIARPRFRP